MCSGSPRDHVRPGVLSRALRRAVWPNRIYGGALQRNDADIAADPKLCVRHGDIARSCLVGRLLSASPLIALFDPLLPVKSAGSRRSEFGQQQSLNVVSPMSPDASVTYLPGRSAAASSVA